MAANVSHARAQGRARRHFRLRKKVAGTAERPRLVVKRSARHILAAVVDDGTGRTLCAASTMEADLRAATGDKSDKARKVGEVIAQRAKAAGIDRVVFDRAGDAYAGRIAALADGARGAGLEF